jgi:hypothetical protein
MSHTHMSSVGTRFIPESFTQLERFLVEKTEEAIRDGVQLERWCRDPNRKVTEKVLELRRPATGEPFALRNEAIGYHSFVSMNGKMESVIGVKQYVDFSKVVGANPEQQLRDYVLGVFLPTANWTYPDGYKGGFTIKQTIFRDMKGGYSIFPEDKQKGCLDWRQLGSEYAWSMLTVNIHDFLMRFGPYLKRFDEAACVVMHPDFVHIVENPTKDYKLEVSVGYPFVAYAPIPNNFGFGPGKFGAAVKLYSFFLTHDNQVKATMDFAAAPRCKKVFDFGPSIPDPVYGGAAILEAVTFGLWKAQPFHDKTDLGMATQHGRVHQALMDGASKVWNDWASR